jgi:hypothetical protein
MVSEAINIDWNKFESVAAQTFKDLHGETNFSDVTLASEDSQQMKAHKIILSSCSPFFKSILLQNPHPQPLIFLKGVNSSDLRHIIKFIRRRRTVFIP